MLWHKLKKILKIKKDLPINTPQSAIFGFLNYENNSDIINHLLLIFRYYLFNSRESKKLSLEVLKKEIVKIYNFGKQICLNDFQKTRKFKKKMRNYRSSATIKHKEFEIRINIVKM